MCSREYPVCAWGVRPGRRGDLWGGMLCRTLSFSSACVHFVFRSPILYLNFTLYVRDTGGYYGKEKVSGAMIRRRKKRGYGAGCDVMSRYL